LSPDASAWLPAAGTPALRVERGNSPSTGMPVEAAKSASAMSANASATDVELRVRAAVLQDAGAIARIYNQGIEERRATFQTRPHGPSDFVERIADRRRPFLVAEDDGELVGWASVLPYSDPAPYYAGVGEATMYVDRSARRRGIGSRLLDELAAEAERCDFHKLVGKIFTSNEPSIELVKRRGYREVGVHLRHGQLDGRWKDVLVVELLLGEASAPGSGPKEAGNE